LEIRKRTISKCDDEGQIELVEYVMPDDAVAFTLSDREALVLFEFLSRFCNDKKLTIEDDSEKRVLCDLLCVLESKLTVPFRDDYPDLLAAARKSLQFEGT
jgi:hypothetical protein